MSQLYTTEKICALVKTDIYSKKESFVPGDINRGETGRQGKKTFLYFLFFLLAQFSVAGHAAWAQASWVSRTSTTTNQLYGIGYGGGQFIAVGALGMVLSSTDGISWSKQTLPGSQELEDALYFNGLWVIGAQAGVIYTSADGVAWTTRTTTSTSYLYELASNGTRLVAVGTNGDVVRSADGVTWTQMNVSADPLYGLDYGNGKFVAVGDNGSIYTSADGATWTSRTSGTTNPLYRVIYANNRFVAVGEDLGSGSGFILYSPDGVTWAQATAPGGTNLLTGVAYTGGKFVAAGLSGSIISSIDGIAWTSETSGTTSDFYDVAWGGGKFAAVGQTGMIRTQDFAGTALPLTWLGFTAVQKDKAIELEWSTATEQDTWDFVVQHSTDGLHWSNLGSVAAAGYSSQEQSYSFLHSDPSTGVNQYRILQRDKDGSQHYSKVIAVTLQSTAGFTVLQNPVGNTLPLQFSSSVPVGGLLQLTDMTGRVIQQQVINSSGILYYQLDVHGLAPGQYLVVLLSQNGKEAKRFIKQ